MNKKDKRSLKKWIFRIFGGLFLLLIGGYLFIAYLLPLPEELVLKPRHISTKIYDRNGELLFEILSEGQGRKSYIQLKDMPEKFIQAIIASEDSNFYSHVGVDLGAISRALFYNYLQQKITSGASTITQQLVRNLLGTNRERSFQEKLLETIYAVRLSHSYSKDQILEEYLNTVYFGNLSYGAEEASKNYFNKNLQDLDLAEISLLAGLPKSPSTYNPLVNPDKAKKRQNYVLSRMVELGNISTKEAEEAGLRDLKFSSGKTPIAAPHFVHNILAELEDKYGEDFIHNGISIYTTLDLNLQYQAERIIQRQLEKLQEKNVGNAALLAATIPDGEILVWVGSKDYFNDEIDGQVDIINSLRQPGSALKPFLYLLALEKGDNLATIIPDLPIKVKTEGGVYSPLNYDLDFHGPVRIREALANSFNIPAVRTQEKLGTSEFLQFLHKFGLNTLDQSPEYYGLALTLGGGEIRMTDLVNAYMTLANYGQKKEFSKVLKIVDSTGKIIYQKSDVSSQNILGNIGKENSALIINTLADPNARLKSFGEGNVLELSIPAAVKTGTTRSFRDNWTFGFSPYLITAVWIGNADASPMENISGIDGAGPIWHDFMEYYHEQNKLLQTKLNRTFNIPSQISEISICAISGLLPGENCQEQIRELFVKGTEPKENDNFWKKFLCTDISGEIKEKQYIAYPYPYIDWAKERNFIPPNNCQIILSESETSTAGDAQIIEIQSPLDGDSFEIVDELPLESQKIPIKAVIRSPNSRIQISIDGEKINIYEINEQNSVFQVKELWLPKKGKHTIKFLIFSKNQEEIKDQEISFFVR